uniref:T9SS type A sorting domain-containing protein n=1 Tax=Flexithrix dorotheae TaxID=70993 RepID=UPI000475A53D
ASLSGLSVPIGLFEKQRNGSSDGAPMEWEFPVSGGTQVKVKIFLIELFNGVTGPGQRVFDIALEGVVPSAMDDIDMFARAGAKKAFMIESVVTVSGDGILDIDFINTGLENPVVSGFEIVEFNEASSRKASQTLVVKEPQNTDYQFDVYPNPTSGILNFDLENNNELPYKLEVFNTLGIKIHELMGNGSGKEQIDLFKLGASHGMYLIVLKVGNSDRELHKIILR